MEKPEDKPGKTAYVIDASALLCLLFGEPGCDAVEAVLPHAMVSAVSYHEVLATLIDLEVVLDDALSMLAALDVPVIAADRTQADLGGMLRSLARDMDLSLGERSSLALARTKGAIAVTTDKKWAGLDLGVQIDVVG